MSCVVALDVAIATADGTVTSDEVALTKEDIERILGPAKFDNDEVEGQLQMPGVALGLAYPQLGGDALFIEASKYAGNGGVKVTHNIQNVMDEFVSIAAA